MSGDHADLARAWALSAWHAGGAGGRKAFERAEKELQKEKPNAKKAVKDLETATGEYPQFAAAWHLLGKVRLRENDANGARDAFEKAISTDSKFVVPLLSLALLELQTQRMAQASDLAGRALKLAPGSGEANYYLAVAEMSLGNMTTAEAAIRAVHASNEATRYPRTHFMLGNILAQNGDVKTAASEFRKFLDAEPASRAGRQGTACRVGGRRFAEWRATPSRHSAASMRVALLLLAVQVVLRLGGGISRTRSWAPLRSARAFGSHFDRRSRTARIGRPIPR
jgi:cytochrome c-type biogenesis protein CcmH/NrfG